MATANNDAHGTPFSSYVKAEDVLDLKSASPFTFTYDSLQSGFHMITSMSINPPQPSQRQNEVPRPPTAESSVFEFLEVFTIIYRSMGVAEKENTECTWDAFQQMYFHRPLCITLMRYSFPFIAQYLGHTTQAGIQCEVILSEIFQSKKNKARILYALAPRQHGKTQFMKVLAAALLCVIIRGQKTGEFTHDEFFRIYFSSKDNHSIETFVAPVYFELVHLPVIIKDRFASLVYTKGDMLITIAFHSGHVNTLKGMTVGSKNRGIPYNIFIRDEILYGQNISSTFTENDRHSIAIKQQFETVMIPTVNVDRVILNYCSAVTQTNPMHQMLRRLPLCCSLAWALACATCIEALRPHSCMHLMWRMCPTDKPVVTVMNLLLVPTDDAQSLFSKVQEELCIPVPGKHVKLQSHLIENIFFGPECNSIPKYITEIIFAVDPCISQNPMAIAAALVGRDNFNPNGDSPSRILVVGGDSSPFRMSSDAIACVHRLMSKMLLQYTPVFLDNQDPITIALIVEKQGGGLAANDYTCAMENYVYQFISQLHSVYMQKRVRPIVVYSPSVIKSRSDNDGISMDEAKWYGLSTSKQSKLVRMDILTDAIKEGIIKYLSITPPTTNTIHLTPSTSIVVAAPTVQPTNKRPRESTSLHDGRRNDVQVHIPPALKPKASSSTPAALTQRRRVDAHTQIPPSKCVFIGGNMNASQFFKQSVDQLISVYQGVEKADNVTLDIPDVLGMIASERIRCINTVVECDPKHSN